MPYKNKEDQIKNSKLYRETHKTERANYGKIYKELHKEELNDYLKKYKKDNAEYFKKYYQDHKEQSKSYYQIHKDEIAQKRRVYRQTHKLELFERNKESRKRFYNNHKKDISDQTHNMLVELKIKILTHYGNGKCACVNCGSEGINHLSIDHINNDGKTHRNSIGILNGGLKFYRWIIKNNYPTGLQTLCMNCQFDKKIEYLNRKRCENGRA